jgi:hypothetical protein
MQKLGMRGRTNSADAEWNLIGGWRVERLFCLFAWLHRFRRLVIRREYSVENLFGLRTRCRGAFQQVSD